MRVYVAGIGVLGPGLQGWATAAAVLRQELVYSPVPLVLEAPSILASKERRRSSPTVRLALSSAQESMDETGLPAEHLATVFGSSNGNGTEIHRILESLSKPGRPVSPTQFHNSVHNSAVGYWCISTGCHQPSTSIACHDYTFAASILKATAQTVSENRPVLVNVFDYPLPEPLHQKRPITAPFAAGFVLLSEKTDDAQAEMSVKWRSGRVKQTEIQSDSSDLRDLWLGNPAARSLPLLQGLAINRPVKIFVSYPENGYLELALS